MKVIQKLFVIVILSVFLISMAVATASAVNVANNEKKDTGITIDSKSKTISYKITWNANGGKIGSKKTVTSTVKKGSKINKLPAPPKLAGYSFKGWYTKKTGGTKINKNTKVKKKVTYYAQWDKVLNAEEKKLVGTWQSYYFEDTYYFTDNGTFIYTSKNAVERASGNYTVSGGKITFTNIEAYYGPNKRDYPKTQVAEYKFEKKSSNEYLLIRSLTYPDMTYLTFSSYTTYSKRF